MKNPFENLEKAQGRHHHPGQLHLIPFQSGVFSFLGPEKKALVPLVIAAPYSSLPSKRSEYDYFFSLNLTVNVSNSLGQSSSRPARTSISRNGDGSGRTPRQVLRFETSFSLEPGDYRLHLLILDNYSGKIGARIRRFPSLIFRGGPRDERYRPVL